MNKKEFEILFKQVVPGIFQEELDALICSYAMGYLESKKNFNHFSIDTEKGIILSNLSKIKIHPWDMIKNQLLTRDCIEFYNIDFPEGRTNPKFSMKELNFHF